MLNVAPAVWRETLDHLRHCGQSGVECVVYWTAHFDTLAHVDGVIHPPHRSTPHFYEIDESWLTKLAVDLHRERRSVLVQVHTHAHDAFHSRTDDENPLVRTHGFLSLVIPRFARSPLVIADFFLGELQADGRWTAPPIPHRLKGLVP